MSGLLGELAERKLVLVTGKGGAGKSCLAVALAHHFHSMGKKVWLVEFGQRDEDAFSRLPELLGTDALQHEPTAACGFHASLLRPTRCLGEYVDRKLPTAGLASVLLNNRVTASLLEVVPGLAELVTLGKVWFTATHPDAEPGPDVTIIDAPASGHAVTLLHSPANFARLTRAGPLFRDAVAMKEFLADPAKTAVVFTALPEEMALSEARDHKDLLGREFPLSVLAVNKIFPEAPAGKGSGKYEVARRYTESRRRREQEAMSGLSRGQESPGGSSQEDWPVLRIPFFFPAPGAPPIPIRMAEAWRR